MRLWRSLRCAVKGILHCIENERNMRIHTVIALYTLLFSSFFRLSSEKFTILILTISAVIIAEMVNTSVEELSDMIVSDYNTVVRTAKDIAAGAVLVSAGFSIVVGVTIFWDVKILSEIIIYFISNYILLVFLILSLILSAIYIFLGPKGIKGKINMFRIKKKIHRENKKEK